VPNAGCSFSVLSSSLSCIQTSILPCGLMEFSQVLNTGRMKCGLSIPTSPVRLSKVISRLDWHNSTRLCRNLVIGAPSTESVIAMK
jgi:hypothetical protein